MTTDIGATARAKDLYPHVFAPIALGSTTVPNRIVRSAHGSGLARGQGIGDEFVAYHEARARGGVGLTILEVAGVHPSFRGGYYLGDDSVLDGFAKLTGVLRKYPMKIFAELGHSGRDGVGPDGAPPLSASTIPSPFWVGRVPPVAMTIAQIEEMVLAFAAAAARVVKAGLDGVEVHCAHGLFLNQFLSPISNLREDRYGGSLENRMRFLVEALTAVRAEVKGTIPVGTRLSSDELTPGGLTAEDTIEVVRILQEKGLIDFLDLSIGSGPSYQKVIAAMDEKPGYELDYSSVVKQKAARVPTIVVGRIRSLAHAEETIKSGQGDLVSMVRAHIADPDLVAKSGRGDAHRVRPCVATNQGCLGGIATFGHISCAVNPDAGFESKPAPAPATVRRRVLVAGGGPAGLEAARTAAERGHEVILCEADEDLGGQLRFARQAPYRGEIGEIVDWFTSEMSELKVDVRLSTPVTAQVVHDVRPDRLIVATGGRPRTDGFQIVRPLRRRLPGADLPHVASSWLVLSGRTQTARQAVVYDDVGHYEAVAVTDFLCAQGASVTVVTRHSRLAPLMEPARAWAAINGRMAKQGVTVIPSSEVALIDSAGVGVRSIYVDPDADSAHIPADLVVMVLYTEPQTLLADQLGLEEAQVQVIGDALSQRFLQMAIFEGRKAGVAA